jgi:3-dehydroquinate synthase
MSAAAPIIRRSAELHLEHIVQGGDAFEATRARPLDFGHWAAHKLEQMTGFSLRHGEAVAIGLAIDARYSVETGLLDDATAARIVSCLQNLGFDLAHAALARTNELLEGLAEFREHLGGQLTVPLLRGIAQPADAHVIDEGLMRRAIASVGEAGQEQAAASRAG